MKTNELRLGNYLQAKNRIVTVTKIFDIDNVGIGSGDPYLVSGNTPCLKPIPLTEELLLKFGFEFQETFFHYDSHTDFYIFKDFRIASYLGSDYELWYKNIEISIEYVHELQNIYFALTGEELTYTC